MQGRGQWGAARDWHLGFTTLGLCRRDQPEAVQGSGVSPCAVEGQLGAARDRHLGFATLGLRRRDQPEAVREALVPALVRGYASHHAGLLPGFKGLVEGLFQRGAAPAVGPTLP